MNKQTALEWFLENLKEYSTPSLIEIDWDEFNQLFEQALAMEKEQMMKTWTKAIDQTQERAWNVIRAYDDFDDYYNETYGGLNE